MRLSIAILCILLSPTLAIAVEVGDICHVEAEAYYPGTWEEYGDDELICNYWRWLGIENPEFEINNPLDDEINEANLFYE
ncbi:hypothetical protein [Pasteurella testudinis]|uniref:hypothetical protein n=1 Tax=Pasteurella testudinis TaxID=761 RepID=UPI00405911CF